jgi:hypothetical protein
MLTSTVLLVLLTSSSASDEARLAAALGEQHLAVAAAETIGAEFVAPARPTTQPAAKPATKPAATPSKSKPTTVRVDLSKIKLPSAPPRLPPKATVAKVKKVEAKLGKVVTVSGGKTRTVVPRPKKIVSVTSLPKAAQTSKTNVKQLKTLERTATPELKAKVAEVRKLNASRKARYVAGYTEAAAIPLEKLAGTKLPQNLEALAKKQNAVAKTAMARVAPVRRDLLAMALKRKPIVAVPRGVKLRSAATPTQGGGVAAGGAPTSSGTSAAQPFAPQVGDVTCSPSVAAFSWKPYMSAVRQQGSCGSCWTYSTMATLEAIERIWNKVDYDLSEQHVLDCASSGGVDAGSCSGGFPHYALDWLVGTGSTRRPGLTRGSRTRAAARAGRTRS